MKGRNYFTLRSPFPGFVEFAYLDTAEHLADQCIISERIVGHFRDAEYYHSDWSEHCMCYCRIRKKNIEQMKAAMDKLWDKMLLLGHTDYPEVCGAVWDMLAQDEKWRAIYGK